ncbi:MAG TPA: GtrA family protein [Mobilitalea sp.]|nr:GtrA family protein [Mobilitalea sp.]
MKEYIQNLKNSEWFNKLFNREIITYAIAGVLTTIINFISYEGLYRLGLTNLKANLLAWVIAVTFAYIVNKLNVFHSKSETVKDEALKVTKFYGARLVSLGVEQLGIYIFVEVLGVYRWIIKGALSVIVIILNYIFSKLYIFNKKKGI